MLFMRNKLRKRLRGLIGIALASFLIVSAICVPAFAETSKPMSGGTNVPDTDIGGATGMESTLIPPISTPNASNGTVAQSGGASSTIGDNAEMTSNIGKVLGIVIAVIVVLAIIALIISFIPRRDRDSDSDKKK